MSTIPKQVTVLTASDGEDALAIYRSYENEIALVLTDFVMPKMGGRELFEALVTIKPDVKVVLMSGYSLKDEVSELHTRGLKGFVQKPLNLENLSGTVRQVLDG